MRSAALALVLMLVAAVPAGAHVVVFPNDDVTRTPACAFTKFVVRVPTEKPIPTTSVQVLIPAGVTVIGVQPKAGGWQAAFGETKGRITSITWSGGKIAPREFDEFAFLAAGPHGVATVNWDALQTYSDGSIVRWTGKPGSDTPHAQTDFTAPAKPCHAHH